MVLLDAHIDIAVPLSNTWLLIISSLVLCLHLLFPFESGSSLKEATDGI